MIKAKGYKLVQGAKPQDLITSMRAYNNSLKLNEKPNVLRTEKFPMIYIVCMVIDMSDSISTRGLTIA